MRSNFSKYFLIIMSFVFLGYLINVYIEKREARLADTYAVESAERCTRNDFKVSDIQWPKGSQDAIGMINSITITNTGNYKCKDIKGIIRFLSNEGTELGKRNFIIPEKIRSKETKIFKNIPLEKHSSVNANEVSVTIVEATFYPEKGG